LADLSAEDHLASTWGLFFDNPGKPWCKSEVFCSAGPAMIQLVVLAGFDLSSDPRCSRPHLALALILPIQL
jgi:hypothetical protein